MVRAVFEFLPSVSEELPLFPGDVIEVLSVVDEFWLLGNKDGVTGEGRGVNGIAELKKVLGTHRPLFQVLFRRQKKNWSILPRFLEY